MYYLNQTGNNKTNVHIFHTIHTYQTEQISDIVVRQAGV